MATVPTRDAHNGRSLRLEAAQLMVPVIRYAVLILGLGFLAWPYILVMYQAFNSSSAFPAPFSGFTLDWFIRLAEYEPFRRALVVSAVVGFGATLFALLLALPAAMAVARGSSKLRGGLATGALSAPNAVPQIVIGLAILQTVTVLAWDLGIASLILGHTILVAPFVLRALVPAVMQTLESLEQVAASLGASRTRIVRTIVLPQLRHAITAACLLAFALSFINLPVSYFLASAASKPVTVEIFNYMSSSIDPLVAALATAIMIGSIALTLIAVRVLKVEIF